MKEKARTVVVQQKGTIYLEGILFYLVSCVLYLVFFLQKKKKVARSNETGNMTKKIVKKILQRT